MRRGTSKNIRSLKFTLKDKDLWHQFVAGKLGLRIMANKSFDIPFTKVRRKHRVFLGYVRQQYLKFPIQATLKKNKENPYCWKISSLIDTTIEIMKFTLPKSIFSSLLCKQIAKFIKLGQYDTILIKDPLNCWILNVYLRSVIQRYFYVTLGCKTGNKLYYYYRKAWKKIFTSQFNKLIQKNQIERLKTVRPINQKFLDKIPIVSFIPKIKKRSEKYRLIMKHRHFNRNVKYAFHYLSNLLLEKQWLTGFGLKGLFEFTKKYDHYKRHNFKNSKKVYFLKLDVKECYDSFNQEKLLSILKRILVSPKEVEIYNIIKYHVLNNYFRKNKSDKEAFRLKQGISQGSILSTMLCNIYIGDFENNCLKPYVSSESLCVRLVDDLLCVFPTKEALKSMQRRIITSRVLSEYNLTYVFDDINSSKFISYLGYRINKNTLSISKHFAQGLTYNSMRYKFSINMSSSSSFTVKVNSIIGKVIQLYVNHIYFNTIINTKDVIAQNIKNLLSLIKFRLQRIRYATGRVFSSSVKSTILLSIARGLDNKMIPKYYKAKIINSTKYLLKTLS